MEQVKNIKIDSRDTEIIITWDKLSGCSGYKIRIYKDSDRKSIVKTRYAEGCRKTLLGFKNGLQLFLTVTPFLKHNGVNTYGPESDVVSFTPISKVFKVNRKTLILSSKDSFQLQGEKNNVSIKDFVFSDYDDSIISVTDSGLITALSKGETILTIKNAENLKDSCQLRVIVDREPAPATIHEQNPFAPDDNGIYCRQKRRCVITLAGDLMCNDISQGQARKNGGFDFTQSFTRIRPLLQKSDLNVGVLESCISHSFPYEGELKRLDNGAPNCNSPAEFLDAIEYAGFNALITANNHCADAGISGLKETIDQIQKHHLVNIGCRISETDEPFSIFDLNGIRICIMAFNCVRNGSETAFYCEDLGFMLADYEKTKAQQQLVLIHEKYSPDFVISYMHWGTMNSSEVTDYQRKTARELAEIGVDFIVGSHPHVLQKTETISAAGRYVPCIYSLGNFFTAMSELQGNRDSALIQITLTKEDDFSMDYEIIHTRTVYINSNYIVEPCSTLTDFDRSDLLYSMQRTRRSIIPDYRNTKEKLKQMTIGKFINEVNGKPNFDISVIKDQVMTRSQVSYYNADVPKSIYFDFPFNDKANPCHNEKNLSILKNNCLMFVTAKPIEGLNCLVVDNAANAYLHYAAWYRTCFNTKVIGVTGSIGKTTVKGLIAAVLSERFTVDSTIESKNVPSAVADCVLRFNENIEYFVMEMASSQPGQIHRSTMVAQPDICVISRIGTAHIDVMKTQQNICNTKFQILDGASSTAPVVLNYDDPFLRDYSELEDHPVISYGIDAEGVNYTAANIREEEGKILFDIKIGDQVKRNFCIHIPGIHNVYNALTAYIIGKWSGMNDDDIRMGLQKYRSVGLRQNIIDVKNNKLIIDCYNASLLSMKGGIDILSKYTPEEGGRRIAIVGDMVSEGNDSEKSHREVGKYAFENNLDHIIAYGDYTKYSAEEFRNRGGEASYFDDKANLIEFAKENIKAGDIILIKGSRAMKMEEIIKEVFPTVKL